MRTTTSRRPLGTPVGLLLVATTAIACQDPAPDTAHHTAEATGETTYFAQYGVSTQAYQPRRLNPSVDGSLYVQGMHWAVWNNRRAVGDGIAHVNDCTPNCADGDYTRYRVTVRLTHPRELCGSRFFTTIRVRGSGYHTYAHWAGVGCR